MEKWYGECDEPDPQEMAYITRCYNHCHNCDRKFNEFECNDCKNQPGMLAYRKLPSITKGRVQEKSDFMDSMEKRSKNELEQRKERDVLNRVACILFLAFFIYMVLFFFL